VSGLCEASNSYHGYVLPLVFSGTLSTSSVGMSQRLGVARTSTTTDMQQHLA